MPRFRVSSASRLAPFLFAALAAGLAGCGQARDLAPSTSGLSDFIFGTNETQAPPAIDPNAPPPQPDIECPPVSVRDGTETWRVYTRGHEGDPAYLVVQGSINKTARECAFSGETGLTIKYGVAGRVLLGPQGSPGTFQLPVRAAFVRAGGESVWSELARVSVTVPPGASRADFAHVSQGFGYDVPPDDVLNRHVLYVGFDEQGAR